MYFDTSEENYVKTNPKVAKERLVGYLSFLVSQQHNQGCHCACQGRGCPVFNGAKGKHCTCFDLFFKSILDMDELGVLRKILEEEV